MAKIKRVQVLERMLSYGNSVNTAVGNVYYSNHFRKPFDMCIYMTQQFLSMVYPWIPESNAWTCVLRDVVITLVAAVFVIASNSIHCSSTVDWINEIGVHSYNAVLHSDKNGWTTATLTNEYHKYVSQKNPETKDIICDSIYVK